MSRTSRALQKTLVLAGDVNDEKFNSAFDWLNQPFSIFGGKKGSALAYALESAKDDEDYDSRRDLVLNCFAAIDKIIERDVGYNISRVERIADLLIEVQPESSQNIISPLSSYISKLIQLRKKLETSDSNIDGRIGYLNGGAAHILTGLMKTGNGDKTSRYIEYAKMLAPLDGRFVMQIAQDAPKDGVNGPQLARAILAVMPQALITNSGAAVTKIFPALMARAEGDPDLQGEIVKAFIDLASGPYVSKEHKTTLIAQIREAAKEDPAAAGLYREVAVSDPDPAAKNVTLVFFKAAQGQTVVAVQNAFVGSPEEYGRYVDDAFRSLPENDASRKHHFNLRSMIDSNDLAQRMESSPSLYEVFMLNARTKAKSWSVPLDTSLKASM